MILVRILGMKMFAPKYFLHLHQNGLHGDGFLYIYIFNYLSKLYSQWQNSYIANGKIELTNNLVGFFTHVVCLH